MIIKTQNLLFAFALLLMSQFALADEYDDTRVIFTNAGESSAYFGKAYGYAIFPNIGKGGIGIGGAYGKGRVYAGGKNDATTISGGYRKGTAIFTVTKGGLMYEATLGGQKFKYKAL